MIVLTRPLPAARRFARLLRARGLTLPVLFAPVLRITPTGQGSLPDGTLLFTSENGVRAAAAMGSLAGRRVFAVGPRTAAVALAFGAKATALGGAVAAMAQALAQDDRGGSPFTHLHGAEVTGDLAASLRAAGLRATARVVYRQNPQPLTEAARTALMSGRPSVLPLFSAKSAQWVARGLVSAPDGAVVVALSAQVRESWPWSGAALVASSTDITGMCDTVMHAVDRLGEGD